MADTAGTAATGAPAAGAAAPEGSPGAAVAGEVADKAAESKQPPAEKKEQERKFKLKINGKERELSESEVIKRAQITEAAQERFAKAAHLEKLEQAIEKGDRRQIQKLLGDERFHKFAVEYFNERLEEEEMTPAQREAKQKRRQLEEENERLKAEKDEYETNAAKALEDHYAKQFDKDFTKAMQETRLPKTPFVVKRMAELMEQNINMKLNLPTVALAELVKEEISTNVKTLMDGLDDEALAVLLGEKVTEKVRKTAIGKTRDPLAGNRAKPQKTQGQTETDKAGRVVPGRRLSKDEFKERLERIKRGEE